MKFLLTIYLIFYTTHTTCFNFNISSNLIKNFLINNNQKYVVSLTCFRPKENIHLMKMLYDLDISLVFGNLLSSQLDMDTNKQMSFIVNVACEGFRNILNVAGEYNFYQFHHKWLILALENTTLNNYLNIMKLFHDVPLRMDSYIKLAVDNGYNQIKLIDVYNKNFNTSQMPEVTDLEDTNKSTAAFPYNLRKNMKNVTLKWSIVCLDIPRAMIQSIDVYFTDVSRKNFDTISKLGYSLFKHIQEIHNFNLELIMVDKWFGNGYYSGVDDGVGKLLYEKSIDFSISPGALKIKRMLVIDYISPIYPFKTSFIFRNLGISSKLQNEFLKPFSTSVWFYILGFTLLFCVVFKFIFRINTLTSNGNEEHSWSAICITIWAVLCQQGASFVTKITSGQCTLLSLLIMSLLLYNYYTSSIVSSLLSGLPPPFTTVFGLSHSDLQVGLQDTPYTRTFFEISTDSNIKYLYNHKILQENGKPLFLKQDEGISEVQKGGFAYHVESSVGYSIIETTFEPYQICDLAEIVLFEPTTLLIMTQKRSQYKKLFAIGYLKMLERGIIRRQQIIWITKKPECLTNTVLVEVGMLHLMPAFILLSFGGFLSIFLLIAEVFYVKYSFRKNRILPIKAIR